MGKKLEYKKVIIETAEKLQRIEREQEGALLRDRVRFIRLLKEGSAQKQSVASSLIGISNRQGQRYWRIYQESGIEGLIHSSKKRGGQKKLDETELKELEEYLKNDNEQFLHEVVDYIKKKYNKNYTVSGVHRVFKRLRVKKKTGRPLNIRQDKEERDKFKKNLNH